MGNIVRFIEYLANHQNGYQVFNYVDQPDLSTKELIKIIEKSLSLKTPSLRIPYLLGLLGGYGFDGSPYYALTSIRACLPKL